jgi:hypothetical protein
VKDYERNKRSNSSADATNEHATSRTTALSADDHTEELYNMSGAVGGVLKALWSFVLCFFDVAFCWQRVRSLPTPSVRVAGVGLRYLWMIC